MYWLFCCECIFLISKILRVLVFRILLNFENNVNKETKDLYSDAFVVVNRGWALSFCFVIQTHALGWRIIILAVSFPFTIWGQNTTHVQVMIATATGVEMATLIPIMVAARVRCNSKHLYVLFYQKVFLTTSEGRLRRDHFKI